MNTPSDYHSRKAGVDAALAARSISTDYEVMPIELGEQTPWSCDVMCLKFRHGTGIWQVFDREVIALAEYLQEGIGDLDPIIARIERACGFPSSDAPSFSTPVEWYDDFDPEIHVCGDRTNII